MKNFNINITDCKPEEFGLVLDILKEALEDKQADSRFWDDINGPAKKKVLKWPSNRRIQLVFTESPSTEIVPPAAEAKDGPEEFCSKCGKGYFPT